MAVDFTRGLVPLDTSPLMKVFAMNEQRKILAEDRARQERIDAMNETTVVLDQKLKRYQLEQLQSNNPQRLQAMSQFGVNTLIDLESLIGLEESGAEDIPELRAKAINNLDNFISYTSGTAFHPSAQRVKEAIMSGDFEGAQEDFKDLTQNIGLMGQMAQELESRAEVNQRLSGQGGDPSAAEESLLRQAEVLQRANPNMTFQEAWDKAVAAEQSRTLVGPTGTITTVNPLMGTSERIRPPLSAGDDAFIRSIEDQAQNIDLWSAAEGTGPTSTGRAALDRFFLGPLKLPISDDNAQNRQQLRNTWTSMIESWSRDERISTQQQQWFREELQIQPQFFDDVRLMRNRFIAINDSLNQRAVMEAETVKDANASTQAIDQAQRMLSSIRTIKGMMKVPDISMSNPSNATVGMVENLSDEMIHRTIDWLGDDLENFPDEVKTAIGVRLSNM